MDIFFNGFHPKHLTCIELAR